MNKKYLTLSVISLLLAAACSQKEEQKTEKKPAESAISSCRHAAVPAQLRDDLQAAVIAHAQKHIANDSHQFIDIDKITSAASQLKLTLNSIQEKDRQCRGKLSIVIPQNVQKTAGKYAPLVGISQYDTVIEERMGSANFQFNGSTLTFPINFTVSGEPVSVAKDEIFDTAAAALTQALLPYGVKENVNLVGRSMTRDMALQAVRMNGGKIPTAPAPTPAPATESAAQAKPVEPKPAPSANPTPPTAAAEKVTPPAPPKPVESAEQKALREAKAAEAKAKAAAEKAAERAAKAKAAREAAEAAKLKAAEQAKTEAPKTETAKTENTKTTAPTASLTPNRANNANTSANANAEIAKSEAVRANEAPKPQPRVSNEELNRVRQAHNEADREIKSSWRKISPDIQKELVEEQKAWERQRTQRCRQAAAAGADDSESNKLYMQCDTRMTKERVKNLEGYSIP